MMHDPRGYVIAIKVNGKTLREDNGKVYLPFNTEYEIFIKNLTLLRVGASVEIDGTDVTNGLVVIDAKDDVTLKRMILGNDLTNGPAFKFVSLSSGQVQDPSEKENGYIKVSFFPEKYPTFDTLYYKTPGTIYNDHGLGDLFDYRDGGGMVSPSSFSDPSAASKGIFRGDTSSRGIVGNTISSPSALYSSTMSDQVNVCSDAVVGTSQLGATVAGNKVSQSFTSIRFSYHPVAFTVMTLRLLGNVEPVLVKDTRSKFCHNCGVKVKLGYRYCSNCGALLTT